MLGWNVPKRHLTEKSHSKPVKLSRPVFATLQFCVSSLQKRVFTFFDEKKTFNICDLTLSLKSTYWQKVRIRNCERQYYLKSLRIKPGKKIIFWYKLYVVPRSLRQLTIFGLFHLCIRAINSPINRLNINFSKIDWESGLLNFITWRSFS